MFSDKIKPLAISYGYERNKNLMVFVSFGQEIEVKNCNPELKKVLPLCNGINTKKDIARKLEKDISKKNIDKIISVLIKNNIVVDSCKLYNVFHKISQNPMQFFNTLTPSEINFLFKEAMKEKYKSKKEFLTFSPRNTSLAKIIKKRKSIRIFDKKKEISFNDISGLAWATLGSFSCNTPKNKKNISYTIPSGGGLYPTNQYLILLKGNEKMKKGIYYCNKNSNEFVMIKPAVSENKLKKAFDPLITKHASFIQVLTSEISRITSKYSNRGYRYALLEAGHAAQNSYLFCSENNLAVVEYGGFCDKETAKLLGVGFNEEIPLICMIVGKKID